MDAEQRYIEVVDFEIDEDLIYKLEDWGFLQYSIPAEVFYNINEVTHKNGFTQKYGGVAPDNKGNPVLFEAMILKQEGDIPILVDVVEIDTDTYLDYIIKNKSLSHDRRD